MKNQTAYLFGWKYNQLQNKAVIKKRSQIDFLISIIIAFLIIIVISQLLSRLDQAIRVPLGNTDFSLINPLAINRVLAAENEAIKMIQSQNDFEMTKSEKIDFSVGFKNNGSSVWQKTGSGKVELRRVDSSGLTFKASLASAENKPGQIGYFYTTLLAPSSVGTYKFNYVLVRDGKTKISGSELQIVIKVVASKSVASSTIASQAIATASSQSVASLAVVNSSAEAIKMIQSQNDFEMTKSEKMDFSVGFKNNGSSVWQKTGSGKVELRRVDSSGLAFKASLAALENKPGQIGYFYTALTAPSSLGTYKFNYVLARDGKTKISGSEFQIVIKVVAAKTKTNTSPSTNNATIAAGNQNKPVGLAEICLSIKPADFKAAMVDQRLIDECLKIGISVTNEGTSYINLQPSPVPVPAPTPTPAPVPIPTPTPNPTPVVDSSYGPLVRIGLYSTSNPITITANYSYKVKDQTQTVLATVPANIQSQITFNFSSRTYSLVANGTNLATSSYLRFESDSANTVFEIVSLNWRPAWNTSLNDNKFLGAIEVRYSPNTNKLWVINELAVENYLKGLAETSNDSPLEYQKALVTAARTYAMYHYNRGTKHAAEYYTLDATYDQVYKGYNSQIRLPKVSQAVEETKGQVVTYNGQVVVTPYFSYSDGHTRNWEDVWGGSSVAWCRSVAEPAGYDKTTMYGHGVGLSAHGALHLAVYYNYTFDQILKYYYTGIELKKIY
ncbi:MAG: SpoIID/LytB domain-containing protein [Patescibacteria group bacterium]